MSSPTAQKIEAFEGLIRVTDLVTSTAVVSGTSYKIGQLVVTGVSSSDFIQADTECLKK